MSSLGAPTVTGSLNPASPKKVARQSAGTELARAIAYWEKEYRKEPKNPKYAVNLAKNLKFAGKENAAIEVLQNSYRFNARDRNVSGELGRLLVKHGHIKEAGPVLVRALDKASPDWRILSALGTVSAREGAMDEARSYFGQALSLVPNKASILNNIAMTYIMQDKPAEAESFLRRAYAMKPGSLIKKNLNRVLKAQGKSPILTEKVQLASRRPGAPETGAAGFAAASQGAPKTTASLEVVSTDDIAPLDLSKR